MSSVALQGNASGTGAFVIASPNSSNNRTLTLPDATDTLAGIAATQTLTNKTLTSPTITGAVVSTMASSVITSGTAVASTSGTSIDFTGLPSWIKRITVMFNGVSLSGTSNCLVQIGSGSVTTSGYASMSARAGVSITGAASSSVAGFIAVISGNTNTLSGQMIIGLQNNNTWTQSSGFYLSVFDNVVWGGGISPALSGTLDRVRITTVNGTDTFDAGSINILYE